MKKIIFVLVICIVLVGFTYILWSNPKLPSQIVISVENMADNIFGANIEEYNEDFRVNKLQIKNSYFYFSKLTNSQKAIYTCVANAVKSIDEKVKVVNYEYENKEKTLEDIDVVIDAFFFDHPEVFYISNEYLVSMVEGIFGTSIEINLKYLVKDKKELDKNIEEIETNINSYISQIENLKGIDAQIKLHDLFAKKVKYYSFDDIEKIPTKYHNIYASFVENMGVCDGFSKAMQILLDRVGIESVLVSGSIDEQTHAWNMVKIDNNWFHMDITSDKSIKERDDIVIHSYFNITTKDILKTHKIDKLDILPEAIDSNNYYKYTEKYISNVDIFETKFRKIMNENNNEILEFGVENNNNVPGKIIDVLKNTPKNNYINKDNRFSYYNILNTYILIKLV